MWARAPCEEKNIKDLKEQWGRLVLRGLRNKWKKLSESKASATLHG
jgi:hypothetical protein